MLITALQVVFLLMAGLSLFDSLTHTFGTIATGGFSTRDASVGGLNNFRAELVIIVFMIIAGGNFSLYYAVLKGNFKIYLPTRNLSSTFSSPPSWRVSSVSIY
jgi:trk system potassium uptake protein